MIEILPIRAEQLPGFCREKGIVPPEGAALRGCAVRQGETSLGWCLAAAGEPCLILGVEAEDSQLADGLLRAALFPLYEGGRRQYRFASPPSLALPERYVTAGPGELSKLFAPCSERKERKDE